MSFPVLEARDLARHYAVRRGMFGGEANVQALVGVSFTLAAGRTLAIVGESGSGKSTLARLLTMIEPPTSGALLIDGIDVADADAATRERLRREIQIVFQNPYGSLNPRQTGSFSPMMTPTHIIVGLAAFGRPGRPKRNVAAALGGFLPDLPIYALYLGATALGYSWTQIWRQMYWGEPWQTLVAVSSSIPLYASLLVAALWWARRAKEPIGALAIFAGAALLHQICDLPVHVDDAHRHFWPLTDWRWHAPVSYWDRRYYGSTVGNLELVLDAVLLAVLFRRFSGLWPRMAVVATAVILIAMPTLIALARSLRA